MHDFIEKDGLYTWQQFDQNFRQMFNLTTESDMTPKAYCGHGSHVTLLLASSHSQKLTLLAVRELSWSMAKWRASFSGDRHGFQAMC